MGTRICYKMEGLEIKKKDVGNVLAAINDLHSDEMLLKYATAGMSGEGVEELPVRKRKWYSYVGNPRDDSGFVDLDDAFHCWGLRDECDKTDYMDNGSYLLSSIEIYGPDIDYRVLLKAIAPFLENGIRMRVYGPSWAKALVVKDGVFSEEEF